MSKPVSLKEIMEGIPADRREKIERRTQELLVEEMSLRELRQARKLTQNRIAKELKIGQEGISRLEKRTDLHLSTLRHYVEAMGGKLKLVAEFPDRPPVVLSGIASLDDGLGTA